MLPLVVPNIRPVGKEGEISQEVTAPPEIVGVIVESSARSLEISTGVEQEIVATWSLIAILTVVDAEPPVLLAQTV